MIDRTARDRVIAAIEAFQSREIRSDAFFSQLVDNCDHTNDSTIDLIKSDLSLLCDDFRDNELDLDKEGWDYVERLRLLLASDAEFAWLSEKSTGSLMCARLVAMVSVIAYAISLGVFGWNAWLLLAHAPLAMLVCLIAYLRKRERSQRRPLDVLIDPFQSWSQLRRTRELASGFRKRRHHEQATQHSRRRSRDSTSSGVESAATWTLIACLMAVAAPLILALQLLLTSRGEWRIVDAP